MKIFISLLLFLLPACVSSQVTYDNGLRIRTAENTNFLTPSLSVMEVSACKDDVESNYTTMHQEDDDAPQVCYGGYEPVALVHGSQSGAGTGLMNAAITGGAMVGTGYLLADGIRDSAARTNINQNGGGANSTSSARSRASNRNRLSNNSNSNAQQFQGQAQGQFQRQTQGQTQIQNPPMMPMGPMD